MARQDSAGAEESMQETVISANGTLRSHVEALAAGLPLTIVREVDRFLCRGRVVGIEDERPDRVPVRLRIQIEGELDPGFEGASGFVAYHCEGHEHLFRTVTRTQRGVLTIDGPAEIRTGPVPSLALRRLARDPGPEGERGGYRLLEVSEMENAAAAQVLGAVSGADLFLRATRRAHLINQAARLEILVSAAQGQGQCAFTLGNDVAVYAVALDRHLLRGNVSGLRLHFVGERPDPEFVPSGVAGALSFFFDGHLYGLPLVVQEWIEGSAVSPMPTRAWRYTRRATPRFDVRHMSMRVAIPDGTRELEGEVVDISLGGLGLRLNGSPPRGATMNVSIIFGPERKVGFKAVCVNIHADEDPAFFRGGFQFADLEAAQLRVIGRLIEKFGVPLRDR